MNILTSEILLISYTLFVIHLGLLIRPSDAKKIVRNFDYFDLGDFAPVQSHREEIISAMVTLCFGGYFM